MIKALRLAAVITIASALLPGRLGPRPERSRYPSRGRSRTTSARAPHPSGPSWTSGTNSDAQSELVSLQPLTRTLLDREMVLVTIADAPITNPQDALRSGKTIVLIAPSVHGGEVSPKEAAQLVAKELLAGDLRPVLDDVIVLILPLVNPDGGEVRRRTNEAGYDMNRDYLKMESQEIHALVTQVLNEWTPDIHVDGHHGGSVPYVVTYQGTLNPAADAALRAYPYENIFPMIREAVQAEDYASFDYSGTRTENGVLGWGVDIRGAQKAPRVHGPHQLHRHPPGDARATPVALCGTGHSRRSQRASATITRSAARCWPKARSSAPPPSSVRLSGPSQPLPACRQSRPDPPVATRWSWSTSSPPEAPSPSGCPTRTRPLDTPSRTCRSI